MQTKSFQSNSRNYVIRRFESGRKETIASGNLDEMLEFLSWCLTDRCRATVVNPYQFIGFTLCEGILLSRQNEFGLSENVTYYILNSDTNYSPLAPDDIDKVYTMVKSHKVYRSKRELINV